MNHIYYIQCFTSEFKVNISALFMALSIIRVCIDDID